MRVRHDCLACSTGPKKHKLIMLAHPCATFLAAAYPALRNRQHLRGFQPLEERTLWWAPSLRSTSMCALKEMVRLLNWFGFFETWTFYCALQFRLLSVWANLHELHRPCTCSKKHLLCVAAIPVFGYRGVLRQQAGSLRSQELRAEGLWNGHPQTTLPTASVGLWGQCGIGILPPT